MMFLFHIALASGLIALTSGVFLYGWACKVEGTCKCMGKCFGLVIIVLATISVLCTIACGISAYRGGAMCMHDMHGMQNSAAMTADTQNAPAMEKLTKPAKPAKH